MEKRILIITNPSSGLKRSVETVINFKEYLDIRDIPYDFYYTSAKKNAQVTVSEQIKEHHTDVVILGGDGTINETANALVNRPVPISIIPTGTGNDFVKMIKVGKKEKEKFETAVYGTLKTIDAGICNDRIFMNGVGVGFDGEIVVEMLRNKTFLSGQPAYYYHVLRILSTYKERPFHYYLDGEEFKNNLILLTIANGTTFGGGFKLTPDAKLDDGFLDICEVGKLSPTRRYLNIAKLQKGTHTKLKAINIYKSKSVKIEESQILNAHIDGEYMGKPPFDIKVLPGKFQVRIKPD